MPEQNFLLEDESSLQLQADKNTAHRFVAFLDIMGFKERVARTNHNKLLAQLTHFNKDITSYKGLQNPQGNLTVVKETINKPQETLRL